MFHMFVLYCVKSSDDFYGTPHIGLQRQVESLHIEVKLSHQIAIDQVTFILSQQVIEVSSISSHRRADVHVTWSIASPMTR